MNSNRLGANCFDRTLLVQPSRLTTQQTQQLVVLRKQRKQLESLRSEFEAKAQLLKHLQRERDRLKDEVAQNTKNQTQATEFSQKVQKQRFQIKHLETEKSELEAKLAKAKNQNCKGLANQLVQEAVRLKCLLQGETAQSRQLQSLFRQLQVEQKKQAGKRSDSALEVQYDLKSKENELRQLQRECTQSKRKSAWLREYVRSLEIGLQNDSKALSGLRVKQDALARESQLLREALLHQEKEADSRLGQMARELSLREAALSEVQARLEKAGLRECESKAARLKKEEQFQSLDQLVLSKTRELEALQLQLKKGQLVAEALAADSSRNRSLISELEQCSRQLGQRLGSLQSARESSQLQSCSERWARLQRDREEQLRRIDELVGSFGL